MFGFDSYEDFDTLEDELFALADCDCEVCQRLYDDLITGEDFTFMAIMENDWERETYWYSHGIDPDEVYPAESAEVEVNSQVLAWAQVPTVEADRWSIRV